MRSLLVCLMLIVALPVHAEPKFGLPTASERKAADISSWMTVSASVAIDAIGTWKDHCTGIWDDCMSSMIKTGARVGVTMGAAEIVKLIVHRDRPCAPVCGIDSPDTSFYSMHTALAFSTVGTRLQFTLPLAIGTGAGRVMANKHYLTDVLVGAGAGLLTSRIR